MKDSQFTSYKERPHRVFALKVDRSQVDKKGYFTCFYLGKEYKYFVGRGSQGVEYWLVAEGWGRPKIITDEDFMKKYTV
jgi:hypothetical protein